MRISRDSEILQPKMNCWHTKLTTNPTCEQSNTRQVLKLNTTQIILTKTQTQFVNQDINTYQNSPSQSKRDERYEPSSRLLWSDLSNVHRHHSVYSARIICMVHSLKGQHEIVNCSKNLTQHLSLLWSFPRLSSCEWKQRNNGGTKSQQVW